MNSETKAVIALVGSALLWSTGGVFIKLVDWNGFAIAGSRSLLAGFVLLIYLKNSNLLMLTDFTTSAGFLTN